MTTMVRGSLKPDLEIVITDAAGAATFTGVSASDVTVIGEQNGQIVMSGQPDTFTPSPDGKSATVKRAWHLGETDNQGRMWVTVRVNWPGTKPQTFPDDAGLRLDITRAAGDA